MRLAGFSFLKPRKVRTSNRKDLSPSSSCVLQGGEAGWRGPPPGRAGHLDPGEATPDLSLFQHPLQHFSIRRLCAFRGSIASLLPPNGELPPPAPFRSTFLASEGGLSPGSVRHVGTGGRLDIHIPLCHWSSTYDEPWQSKGSGLRVDRGEGGDSTLTWPPWRSKIWTWATQKTELFWKTEFSCRHLEDGAQPSALLAQINFAWQSPKSLLPFWKPSSQPPRSDFLSRCLPSTQIPHFLLFLPNFPLAPLYSCCFCPDPLASLHPNPVELCPPYP